MTRPQWPCKHKRFNCVSLHSQQQNEGHLKTPNYIHQDCVMTRICDKMILAGSTGLATVANNRELLTIERGPELKAFHSVNMTAPKVVLSSPLCEHSHACRRQNSISTHFQVLTMFRAEDPNARQQKNSQLVPLWPRCSR